jgi:hypothetical protein
LDEKMNWGEKGDKIDDVAVRTEAILDAAQASDIRSRERSNLLHLMLYRKIGIYFLP